MKTLKSFCVCVVLLFLACPIFAQTADEQAVRGIVNNFYLAFQKKDEANIKQFWKSDSPHLADFLKQTAKTFAENETVSVGHSVSSLVAVG